MFNERLVFLDLETTGGSAAYDRIIEIGLVEIDCGRLIGEWSTLVNPERFVPPAIQNLTGITEEMVATAPSFAQIAPQLAARLEGKVLAAHNARFDYGFLRNEFQRSGIRYSARVLCTVKLSRRLFPQHRRHNLDALMMRHAIFCIDRHRALGDAQVLWSLAQIWKRDCGEATLSAACDYALRAPAVPTGLPADFIESLPDSAGVYVFYGDRDVALYVGKSTNIRNGVTAHFCGDRALRRDVEIAKEVKRVDWIETAGELGATIEERRLVSDLAPLHNRRTQPDSELCAWRWQLADPIAPPQLVSLCEVPDDSAIGLYGVFRSTAGAREALRSIASARGLCRVLLGLEARNERGACAGYESGRCRGACVGLESAMQHALRVAQGLSTLRVKPWPYAGRIAVRERNVHTPRCDLHVLDHWCYVGRAQSEADLAELTCERNRPAFDPGLYRILARFLRSPPSTCDILALPSS